MSLFKWNDKQSILKRKQDTQIFEAVMQEIKQGDIQQGIWGQALVEANGDEAKTEAIYIRMRAEALKDELRLINIAEREFAEAQKPKAAPKNITQPEPEARSKKSKPEKTTSEHDYAGYKYELNLNTGEVLVVYDPHQSRLDETLEGKKFPNSWELRQAVDIRVLQVPLASSDNKPSS